MDNKMFEKENTIILKKKHNFFEELFIKDIEKEAMSSSEDHIIALQKQNSKLEKMSSVFGIISFAALIGLCVSLNSSGKSSAKIELENNYQEVISQALNLAPWEDTNNLSKSLDKSLQTKSAFKVDKGSEVLNYHVPSKFYSPGSSVKIEYKNVINEHDMITFTFPNLSKTGFGNLEKKVLMEKIQERNFPGYIISMNNPQGNEELVAVFLKNYGLQGRPVNTTSLPPLPKLPSISDKIMVPQLPDITKSDILNTTVDNNPWSEKIPALSDKEKAELLKIPSTAIVN